MNPDQLIKCLEELECNGFDLNHIRRTVAFTAPEDFEKITYCLIRICNFKYSQNKKIINILKKFNTNGNLPNQSQGKTR